ncbi:hypothetical protein L1987_15049 [Smallanthus sonchifolius]|uniref:Uncharacterized protein n=1 Tax=Smallanthus sonchifolius TaxID=185202 RepID=A0ACB9J626_9ASTR|nr:hypothetical protein L1987_15049 [Smallanthus sonchifolius]
MNVLAEIQGLEKWEDVLAGISDEKVDDEVEVEKPIDVEEKVDDNGDSDDDEDGGDDEGDDSGNAGGDGENSGSDDDNGGKGARETTQILHGLSHITMNMKLWMDRRWKPTFPLIEECGSSLFLLSLILSSRKSSQRKPRTPAK